MDGMANEENSLQSAEQTLQESKDKLWREKRANEIIEMTCIQK